MNLVHGTLPVRRWCNVDYVRVDTLAGAEQEPFAQWLHDQTRPVIPTEVAADGSAAMCAYAWDYATWLHAHLNGRVAQPLD